MKHTRMGFIGLGLIGGSIAKSIKRFFPSYEVLAYDTDKETLSVALREGIIDCTASAIDKQFESCEFIFLCAPVSYNAAYLSQIKAIINPSCILTDVGSVKTNIHEKVIELGLEENFIGGHPMTGSERSGFHNSTNYLLENSYYVLTPSARVSRQMVEVYQAFVESLGAISIILDYREHDYITAAISHLPHIIASSLVNLIKDSDSADEKMKLIAAGGFKDITRIASSSPDMWQQICLTNTDNINKILQLYITSLTQFKGILEEESLDSLYDFFQSAREYRNSIPSSSLGPIKKIYELYCDIIDEAGGIATIATILASNHINIKNIGIIHNREFEEGILKIEFYEEKPAKKAVELLKKYHYTVYER